ncbi:MAG: hypothetical protein ACRC2T_01025 [Thermoguttaceae bacterium]
MDNPIPQHLLNYDLDTVPLISNAWKCVEDETNGTVKIVRYRRYLSYVLGSLFFSCIMWSPAYYLYVREGGLDFVLNEDMNAFFFCISVIMGTACWIIPLYIMQFGYWRDANKWPATRISFNSLKNEILFYEDTAYYIPDCQSVVVGLTTGFDTQHCECDKHGYEGGYNKGAHLYILIKKDDEWKKYLIAHEMSLAQINKTAQILARYLKCQTVITKKTFKECFDLHHPKDTEFVVPREEKVFRKRN